MAFDWSGKSYPKYDRKKEGGGSPAEWASTFNVRMGFKEAQAHKARRGWKNDWEVMSDISGVHVDSNSMWSEIKSAFKKAAMKCHPDRCTQHGMTEKEATEKFQDAQAAFSMLEDIYTVQGRLE